EHLIKLDPGQGIQAQVEIARAQKQDAAAIDENLKKALDLRATRYDLHMIQGNYLASKKRNAAAEQHARASIASHPVHAGANDLRFAIRTLAKNPGFTAVAVTALALGIGVNATVFSLANAILFKDLPFADSERVVFLTSANSHRFAGPGGISYADFHDLQA